MLRIDAMFHHFSLGEIDQTGLSDPDVVAQRYYRQLHNDASDVLGSLIREKDTLYALRDDALITFGLDSRQYEQTLASIADFEKRYVQAVATVLATNEPLAPQTMDHRVIDDEGWWLVPHEYYVLHHEQFGKSLEQVIWGQSDTRLRIGRIPKLDVLFADNHQ
jgi:hypothetical protein